MSNYYANGRVAVLSSKLLSQDKFNRLMDADSVEDALKMLSEMGYGDSTSSYQNALGEHLAETIRLLVELSTNQHITMFMLARYNYHNAKALAKCKYRRLDGKSLCYDFATIPVDSLQEAINGDKYGELPKPMAEALLAIDNLHVDNNDTPQVVETIIDKAMYADMQICASKIRLPYFRKYLSLDIDTTNIILLYRAKYMQLDEAIYADMIIDGGTLDRDWLVEAYGSDNAQIISHLTYSPMRPLAELMAESSSNIVSAEQLARVLLWHAMGEIDDSSFMPVIKYVNNKINEIDKIRYIVMCIKNGVSRDVIVGKVKELYA